MFNSQTQDGYSISVPMEFHHYKIVEYIGCGSTCIVVLVIDTNTDTEYAAKIISMTDMKNRNLVNTISNEINILRAIEHPNIIEIYERGVIEKENGETMFVIVTDYCSNGDLVQYISKNRYP